MYPVRQGAQCHIHVKYHAQTDSRVWTESDSSLDLYTSEIFIKFC